MKLAIAQIVLGAIIASDYACLSLLGWGWLLRVIHGAGWLLGVMTFYAVIVYIVLGLSVLGCGVAQFLKAREARS
ncbi:hypothetical protein ES705_39053 [subsurface metagenome]